MVDSDERDEIRQRKREQLIEQASAPTAPTEPIHVSGGAHLDEVVAQYDIVLVDFHADWCGPCQMLEPTVEEIATETEAAVAKVDIDANQALAQTYGVRGVPTLLLFADGEATEQLVGVQDKATLVQLIERVA